jgi:hypothetical protein
MDKEEREENGFACRQWSGGWIYSVKLIRLFLFLLNARDCFCEAIVRQTIDGAGILCFSQIMIWIAVGFRFQVCVILSLLKFMGRSIMKNQTYH